MSPIISSTLSHGASFLGEGTVGAFACKITGNLTKIGNPLSYLNKITPQFVSDFLTQGPIHQLVNKGNIAIFLLCRSMKLGSSTGVPILEEFVFRYGIQQGLTLGLTYLGVDSTTAKVISVGLSSLVFATSHGHSMDSEQCLDLFLKGAIFGRLLNMMVLKGRLLHTL